MFTVFKRREREKVRNYQSESMPEKKFGSENQLNPTPPGNGIVPKKILEPRSRPKRLSPVRHPARFFSRLLEPRPGVPDDDVPECANGKRQVGFSGTSIFTAFRLYFHGLLTSLGSMLQILPVSPHNANRR